MKSNLIMIAAITAVLSSNLMAEPVSISMHASPDVIKDKIVAFMTANNFRIGSDNKYQVSFWQEMSGASGFMTRVLAGSSYSEKPKREITFNLIPSGEQTTIQASGEITIRQAFGTVDRIDMTKGKGRTDLMNILNSLVDSMESDYRAQSKSATIVINASIVHIKEVLKERGKAKGWELTSEDDSSVGQIHERLIGNVPSGQYIVNFTINSLNNSQCVLSYIAKIAKDGSAVDANEQEQRALIQSLNASLSQIKEQAETVAAPSM